MDFLELCSLVCGQIIVLLFCFLDTIVELDAINENYCFIRK